MKTIKIVLCIFILLVCGCNQKQDNKAKVILDCDNYFFGDDTMVMSLLLQADAKEEIDLMGISVVGGNTFVYEGTNICLRSLELFERADIRVYQGEDIPLNGFPENVEYKEKWGAISEQSSYRDPSEWNSYPISEENLKYGYAETIKPQAENAVDFLVDSVKKYPGEITIIAVGPLTNIALAIKKDPDFAKNVKEIIFMGATFEMAGNITEYAEYNVFYDPVAFDIFLKADFLKRTIVPNEISSVLQFDQTAYEMMKQKPETPISKAWITYSYNEMFKDKTYSETNVWDVATALYFLKPELFTRVEKHGVKVNCDINAKEYGQTTLNDNGDITIVFSVDNAKAWDYYTDMLSLSDNKITGIFYDDVYKQNN